MTYTALEKPRAFKNWTKANHATLIETFGDFQRDVPDSDLGFFMFTVQMWTEINQAPWLQ